MILYSLLNFIGYSKLYVLYINTIKTAIYSFII